MRGECRRQILHLEIPIAPVRRIDSRRVLRALIDPLVVAGQRGFVGRHCVPRRRGRALRVWLRMRMRKGIEMRVFLVAVLRDAGLPRRAR